MLPLALLALVHGAGSQARVRSINRHAVVVHGWRRHRGRVRRLLDDSYAHVAPVTSLPAVALILAHTAVSRDASIFAALARTLAITSLLALAASLTARLAGEVFLISTKLVLEVERSARCLARLRWQGVW